MTEDTKNKKKKNNKKCYLSFISLQSGIPDDLSIAVDGNEFVQRKQYNFYNSKHIDSGKIYTAKLYKWLERFWRY